LFSGYYRDSNDLEDGRGDTLLGSGSRDNGVLAKAEWQINDAHSVTFNYRQADVDGQVPSNGAAQITSTSNPLIEREQSTQNLSVDYRFDTESELVNGQVLAYWNQVEMDETRLSDGRADSTELDVLGLNINNLSRFGDIELLYGIDGYQESFDTQRGGSNRPQPPEAESEVWGGFVQANIPFAEVFRVEVGARYDYFATKAKNLGSDRSDNDLSPSVALVWQSTDWLELTLRHDQAFRAPSAEELYSTGTHFCMFPGFCNTFVANPDLDAEQAANTELLAKMQFTDLLGDDSLSITASVFENKVDDFIEQIVDDPTFFPVMSAGNTTWVNVDEASIEGFEVSANYQRDALFVVMSYGQTRGEDDQTGEDLTNIPADTFITDVSYGFFDRQLTAGVRVTVADDQHRSDYAENTAGTEYDSYSITDLYASWQPASWDAVKVDLTLNNVTDRDYRKAWANLDEAGREVIVSARYRF
jgi:hemoglobin/transferrin/lactoferrin receptor protein